MIEFFSEWTGQLVVALIIGTLLEMIMPKGKNKKYVKMLIGIYIIFCMISPFTQINETFSLGSISEKIEEYGKESIQENQTSMDARLEELYIEEIEKSISEELYNIGYEVKKCEVQANLNSKIDKSGIESITIKVKKYIKEESDIEKVENVNISINNHKKENTTNIEDDDIKIIKKIILEKYEVQEEKVHISD